MSGHQSPFAALTGAEKQIKWLEYQSIRLPYVQGSVDAPVEEQPPKHHTSDIVPNEHVHTQTNAQPQGSPTCPQPGQAPDTDKPCMQQQKQPIQQSAPATYAQPIKPNDFQKTRHRQYDAVIARMKQAEQRARGFNTLS